METALDDLPIGAVAAAAESSKSRAAEAEGGKKTKRCGGVGGMAAGGTRRAVAGAGVLSGYDQLQLIVFGKKFSGGGG